MRAGMPRQQGTGAGEAGQPGSRLQPPCPGEARGSLATRWPLGTQPGTPQAAPEGLTVCTTRGRLGEPDASCSNRSLPRLRTFSYLLNGEARFNEALQLPCHQAAVTWHIKFLEVRDFAP